LKATSPFQLFHFLLDSLIPAKTFDLQTMDAPGDEDLYFR
jgi:hypothetical protein